MMQAKKLSGSIGAELHGVDLSVGAVNATSDFPEELAANLRHALLQHQVIFIRDQALTPASFLRFAKAMGEPVEC